MSEVITSAKPLTAADPAPDFTEQSLRFEPGVNDLSLHGIIAGTFDYLGCERS